MPKNVDALMRTIKALTFPANLILSDLGLTTFAYSAAVIYSGTKNGEMLKDIFTLTEKNNTLIDEISDFLGQNTDFCKNCLETIETTRPEEVEVIAEHETEDSNKTFVMKKYNIPDKKDVNKIAQSLLPIQIMLQLITGLVRFGIQVIDNKIILALSSIAFAAPHIWTAHCYRRKLEKLIEQYATLLETYDMIGKENASFLKTTRDQLRDKLETTMDELETTTDTLQKTRADLKATTDKLNITKNNLDELQTTNADLETALQTTKGKLETSSKIVESLREKITWLKKMLNARRNSCPSRFFQNDIQPKEKSSNSNISDRRSS